MNLNYELSDKVWWRPAFFSYNNKEFLKLIRLYRDSAQEFFDKKENAELIKDYERECKIMYLRDCLIGEKNINECSTQYIEKILVDTSLISKEGTDAAGETTEKEISLNVLSVDEAALISKRLQKEKIKIVNMYSAIQDVFPSLVLPNLDMRKFNVVFSNSIHSKIGSGGLIETPGAYRTSDAMPYGENFKYLKFEEISNEMETLFTKTRDEMQNIMIISDHKSKSLSEDETELQIEKVIKIASQFLNSFLYIHPYSNGNGRTARLLTSYLLLGISVFPVSVTVENHSLTYLECLRQLHFDSNVDQSPTVLATLLLERTFYTLDFFNKIVLTGV